MVLLKLKQSWKELWVWFPDMLRILKVINRDMKGISPWFVRFTWFAAIAAIPGKLVGFATAGYVLQKLTEGFLTAQTITPRLVAFAAIAGIIYYIGAGLIGSLGEWYGEVNKAKFDYWFGQRLTRHLHSLDLARLIDPDFIAMREEVQSQGKQAFQSLWGSQMRFVLTLVGTITALGIISVLDPVLILLGLLPLIPEVVESLIVQQRRRNLRRQSHLLRRKAHVYSKAVSDGDTIVQMKLFRFLPHMWQKTLEFRDVLIKNELDLDRFSIKWSYTLYMIEKAMVIAAWVYLGLKFTRGESSIAELSLLVGTMQTFTSSITGLTEVVTEAHGNYMDFLPLEQYLNTKPLIDESEAREIEFPSVPQLRLDEVMFAYPRQPGLALQGCTLCIEPGVKVAIVGPNGSGKTTVARLLSKTFVPQSGYVFIDRTSIQEIRQESWLEHILYVTQDSTLLDLPIAEALTGTDPKHVDMDRLVKAAEITGAHEFVSCLPEGYQTQIGQDWPGGIDFSTGQRQRLKLAAAFYRLMSSKVHIAFFDEPMAHCDVETREHFYQTLGQIQGKTIIVIAHDPLYLHHFERVIVMDQGRVIKDIRGKEKILAYRSQIAMNLSVDL